VRQLYLAEARARAPRHLELARQLGRLEARDLTLDRREHPLALRELRLDRRLLRRAVGDDLPLLAARALQLRLPPDHVAAEAHDLVQHPGVLLRDAVRRIEAAHHVVEALGPEDHLEPGVVGVRGVERDEPPLERLLADLQVRPGDDEVVAVDLEILLDPRELDIREVVRLDRLLELRVAALDLREHARCLRALRRHGGVSGGRNCDQQGRGDSESYE